MSDKHHLKLTISKIYHHTTMLGLLTIFIVILGACSIFQRGRQNPTPEVEPSDTPDVETISSATLPPMMATESNEDQAAHELLDKIWVLVAYGNLVSPTVVEPGTVVTAEFDSNGSLSGSTGCNNYSAAFEIDDKTISVGPIASTMMACEIGAEQEKAYLEALEAVEGYLVTPEGRLEVIYNLGQAYETRLIFSEGKTPLRDTTWILISYGDPNEPTD